MNNHISESSKQIKFIQESLASNNIKNRIPEEVFVGNFLPLFANIKEAIPKNVDISIWIAIAGSPFKEVDVVDNSNVVIFTVPPIFCNNSIKPLSERGEQITNIVAIAEKLSLRSPIEANMYVQNKLYNINKKLHNPIDDSSYKTEWNNIFKRYNIDYSFDIKKEENNEPLTGSIPVGEDLGFTPI